MQNQHKLILATDLDGTFLEGNEQIKSVFYNKLSSLRDQVMLIYVTGRLVDVVEYFCKNGDLPNPHYVIADHGTHIVDGINFIPIKKIQKSIIHCWNNGN